ncbi:MAG: response regulator transcription factor [Chloroflexota bacterium]|nr:response regulator transcription factor [Chloroflexota bacterium]
MRILDAQPDIQVIGEASDAAEAVWMAGALSPDVILIEAGLPDGGAVKASSAIRRRDPHVAVVVVASRIDEDQLFDAIKAGAAAFVTRDIGWDDLVEVVRRVGCGEYLINDTFMSYPSVVSRVLKEFRDLEDGGGYEVNIFSPLGSREVEVLDCIVRGMSNKEIARLLLVSDQTVKNHISSILRKLAVNDRTQAAMYAVRVGWIRMPPELG